MEAIVSSAADHPPSTYAAGSSGTVGVSSLPPLVSSDDRPTADFKLALKDVLNAVLVTTLSPSTAAHRSNCTCRSAEECTYSDLATRLHTRDHRHSQGLTALADALLVDTTMVPNMGAHIDRCSRSHGCRIADRIAMDLCGPDGHRGCRRQAVLNALASFAISHGGGRSWTPSNVSSISTWCLLTSAR